MCAQTHQENSYGRLGHCYRLYKLGIGFSWRILTWLLWMWSQCWYHCWNLVHCPCQHMVMLWRHHQGFSYLPLRGNIFCICCRSIFTWFEIFITSVIIILFLLYFVLIFYLGHTVVIVDSVIMLLVLILQSWKSYGQEFRLNPFPRKNLQRYLEW